MPRYTVKAWFFGGPQDTEVREIAMMPSGIPRHRIETLVEEEAETYGRYRYEWVKPSKGFYDLICYDMLRRTAVYHYQGEVRE